MRLGVPFIRDHLNRTKIQTLNCSKFLVNRVNIELSRVNEVSGQIFSPVENSSDAMCFVLNKLYIKVFFEHRNL